MSEESFGLLLAFDSDDPRFCDGVEVGHVWTMLQHTQEREFTVHARNAEMIIRIADALDMTVRSEEHGEGWLHVAYEDAVAVPQADKRT